MKRASRARRRPRGLGLLASGLGLLALLLAAISASSCATGPSPLASEWRDIGNAWFDKGEWKRAGEAYSKALKLDPSLAEDPSLADASYNLARALAEAGDFDESLLILNRLDKQDPKNVRILTTRAWVIYKTGKPDQALKDYETVMALTSKDPKGPIESYAPDVVFNAAVLKLAAGDPAGAAVDLERLAKGKPDDGATLLLLARAYDEAKNPAKALVSYEKARDLGKADAEALEWIGNAYAEARRFADSIKALEEATKADPKRAKAWFTLAKIKLGEAEDGEGGLAALTSALEAGFADKKAATELIALPVLAEREKALGLLKAKGLAE